MLSEQVAALLQSLAGNHAFVDGNERISFAAAAVFLRTNGYALVDDVIVGRVDVAAIAG